MLDVNTEERLFPARRSRYSKAVQWAVGGVSTSALDSSANQQARSPMTSALRNNEARRHRQTSRFKRRAIKCGPDTNRTEICPISVSSHHMSHTYSHSHILTRRIRSAAFNAVEQKTSRSATYVLQPSAASFPAARFLNQRRMLMI